MRITDINFPCLYEFVEFCRTAPIGYNKGKYEEICTAVFQYFAQLKQRNGDGCDWEEEVDRAIRLARLGPQSDMQCGKLSGGMVRRLGIAQAIMGKPDLVLLAEPTAGLDIEERLHLKDILEQIRGTPPVILSTHIVEDMESTCQQMIVLDKGTVIFTGKTSELIECAQGQVYLLSEEVLGGV